MMVEDGAGKSRIKIKKDSLNDYEQDALKEVGNMAAAHAATALSKVTDERIIIDVTDSNIFKIEDIPNLFDSVDEKVAAIYMQLAGNYSGKTMMILPHQRAMNIADIMFGETESSEGDKAEYSKEALSEIGNICICAYLNAISEFLDITLMPSPPSVSMDNLKAILEYPACTIGEDSNYAIIIQTMLEYDQKNFSGTILFMPGDRPQKLIMEKFGID